MNEDKFGIALIGGIAVLGGVLFVRTGGFVYTGPGALINAAWIAGALFAAVGVLKAVSTVRGAHGGSNHRWITAVHEASHKVAAEQKGSATSYFTNEAGTRGYTSYSINGSAVDEAVVLLAGSIGARKITGSSGLACSNDISRARALLRGTGVSESQARAMAARAVSNTGRIKSYARQIDRTGRA